MPLQMIKPQALKEGDAVGVVAPASPPADPEDLDRGIAVLAAIGLRVRLGRHARERRGYLAGSDRDRAADLMEMFRDPTVQAIFCVRGGYGSGRLLHLLDYGVIRRHPKVFVGYSDVTALHLAIHRRAGLVTFHGPMVAGDLARGLAPFTADFLRRALFRAAPLGLVANPPDLPPAVAIRGGVARGPLVGGNLSLVVATLGTPYEIETAGRILFLEEVGEAPYRIDRMLTHLRQAGKLDGVAGVAFGEWAERGVEEVVRDRLGDIGFPVLGNLAIGHGAEKATLPLGVRATLNATAGWLSIDEPAVTP